MGKDGKNTESTPIRFRIFLELTGMKVHPAFFGIVWNRVEPSGVVQSHPKTYGII